MKFLLFIIWLFVFTLSGSLYSEEMVVWNEDFRGGVGSAKAYRGAEQVEVIEEEGESFLRVSLPGKVPLEGVRISPGAMDGNGLLMVRAKVRGSGSLGAMIQAANGWTRLPEMTLSEEWEEIKIPKTLKAGNNHPIIYFVSLPMDALQPGAVFEIADLEGTMSEPLALSDVEVRSMRLEVEDYAPTAQFVRIEDDVTCVVVSQSFATTEIPFPQTSRGVSLYVRYRAASLEDRIQICTRRGGYKQAVREVNPVTEGWQWMEIPEIGTEEVGEGISIESWPKKGGGQVAALDALVISTTPGLGETELESIK